jgi:S1-C subfamily serine protease
LNLTEAINEINPCIVQINAFASGFSEEFQRQVGAPFLNHVLGTGFFVNSDAYVIIARHVILAGNDFLGRINAERKNIAVSIGLPNSTNFIANRVGVGFDLIGEDENYDLSVLRLLRNPFRGEVSSGIRIDERDIPVPASAVKLRRERPMEGQWIGISGYPLEKRVLVTNSGHIASVWTIPNYLADIEVNPGNSGGPVYLVEDASIIGVCVALTGSNVWNEHGERQNLFYSAGLTSIIPTTRIIELLDRHQISYNEVSGQ